MRSRFNKYLLSFCFVLISSTMFGHKPPPLPTGAPNPGLPIDGGMSFLLISGIAYGIYELKRKK